MLTCANFFLGKWSKMKSAEDKPQPGLTVVFSSVEQVH